MAIVDAKEIAEPFLAETRAAVAELGDVNLVGLLSTEARASDVYSRYAQKGCEAVGIHYEPRRIEAERVSAEIFEINEDPSVHGVIVFYPVFGGARDRSLQNEVDPSKDVEGLHAKWSHRLYHDVRYVDPAKKKKSVLPCTPLGIRKALGQLGVTRTNCSPRESAAGLVATIFNRSEIVGRPLAAMLAHDGARVYSFDINGLVVYDGPAARASDVTRGQALAESDIVVTGVPSTSFERVRAAEIKAGATCINFSFVKNFEDDVADKAKHTLLRVGPITVAMLLRNTVRLFRNFHQAD